MNDTVVPAGASTPEAAKATVQSRGESLETGDTDAVDLYRADTGAAQARPTGECGEGRRYTIGDGVRHATTFEPYRRQAGEPLYRPLKIFALDPSIPRLRGRTALVNVPYEPLTPGPVGMMFEVHDFDETRDVLYNPVDLDAPFVLIENGLTPSIANPMFHQQMVYAVCSLVYASFRTALGRYIAWGFDPEVRGTDPKHGPPRLRIRPHARCGERNAYYDPEKGELCFGYFKASPEEVSGRNLPSGWVFTCLSHDVIAHEVTHAVLDGLRSRFMEPTGPDVIAFHEAFADLIALFQHFTYKELVETAIRETRGKLENSRLLTDIAVQFGETTGLGNSALRSALDDAGGNPNREPNRVYDPSLECHELGAVLVAAVFEAFLTIYRRKTARFIRIATGGSGVLPRGDLPADLQSVLADEASKLASQFLSICIRALDYCPPVDLRFGEYLRAVITADYDLVPDDPWGYREAWIDAFRRRRIFPEHVVSLSEEVLLWRVPLTKLLPEENLSFARLQFRGDPGSPVLPDDLYRQACTLGDYLTLPQWCREFGVVAPGCPEWDPARFDLPRVESIRVSRRVGPDQQIVFDLVAEVTQCRKVQMDDGRPYSFWGGSTVIMGPDGDVRYVIRKDVGNAMRQNDQTTFMQQESGRRFWRATGRNGEYHPERNLFRMLHRQ